MKPKNPWAWVPSLYFAEGLPYVAVMTISILVYKQLGLSNTEITFYTSWFNLPWLIKPLWSPFVDLVKTKRWWITCMQLLLAAAFGGVAFTIGKSFWLEGTMFFFWIMAFCSATHDIAADGFYMLGLDEHHQAMFVGVRSLFYRLATIFGSGILVVLAGLVQVQFRGEIRLSWCLVFYAVAGLIIGLWLWHRFALPVPAEDAPRTGVTVNNIMAEFGHTVKTFFEKPQFFTALLFILFYRMPEGLLVKVSALFLIDPPHNGGLGLSPQDYGFVNGTVGVIALIVGGILGGVVVSRDGLKRWLWPMVASITLPDLVYVYLSYTLPDNLFIVSACIAVEQFGYGFGFTAYMLYLVYFSQGSYKTSHYALCTAFMSLSLMLPGFVAGMLQESVGYQTFFIIVVCMCILTPIVSLFLKIDPKFGLKDKGE